MSACLTDGILTVTTKDGIDAYDVISRTETVWTIKKRVFFADGWITLDEGYSVDVDRDHCTCQAWRFRKTCKHLLAVREVSMNARMNEVATIPPVSVPTNGNGGTVALSGPGCPSLSQALAGARDRCKMAVKDKRNDYHKYSYASADEIIATASEALAGSGLAIIPESQELVTVGSGTTSVFALNRTVLISHASGEYVPLRINGWPVIPERGRPLDKAFAIALTSSLSYMLRDLLQMPRGDSADMNARVDNEPPQKEPEHKPDVGFAPSRPYLLQQAQSASAQFEPLTFKSRLETKYGVNTLDELTDEQLSELVVLLTKSQT